VEKEEAEEEEEEEEEEVGCHSLQCFLSRPIVFFFLFAFFFLSFFFLFALLGEGQDVEEVAYNGI
jgi:hypothetical protein